MKKPGEHYSPEEKVAILRRHLLEKEPISKLCDELGLQPTVFYHWQKEFFENGAAAFEPKRPSNHSAEQERIAYLEKKIQANDEVLAERVAEHVARVTAAEVRQFVEDETAYMKRHMTAVLRNLEHNGLVHVHATKSDGQKRRASSYPDTAVLEFPGRDQM